MKWWLLYSFKHFSDSREVPLLFFRCIKCYLKSVTNWLRVYLTLFQHLRKKNEIEKLVYCDIWKKAHQSLKDYENPVWVTEDITHLPLKSVTDS